MSLRTEIAKDHKIRTVDKFYGYDRIVFDFNGHVAWIVCPKGKPRKDRAWSWVMQWATEFVRRTNVPQLLDAGYHHVTIDTFRDRMDENGLKISSDFQRYLVERLGFAPKANLIGMSWGGFFSVRYAARHPQNVAKIYLDAPLLTFEDFAQDIGPWTGRRPANGWRDSPEMPVNAAGRIASAGIPVLLLYGGKDGTCPPWLNAEPFAERFRSAGGDIKVVCRGLYGHHPHGIELNETDILDFFENAHKDCMSAGADGPEEAFRRPPHAASPGVWWHWMGSQVSREGIVRDLDYFHRMGIGYATIFGMADTVAPWATPVPGGPFPQVVAFTPEWWKLVKLACAEGRRRGIEIGLHNCPGYTSTGGPWIPARLAMRELVFDVSATNPVPLAANARYPIWDWKRERFGFPELPERRTDLVDIATVGGVRVSHVPMGAFVQPAQPGAWGLECDKMNPEAVAFHMDHVIGEMKRHLGEEVGKGLTYVLLDSYEAGVPTWTPNMAAEFRARRGYDCVPFLPVLGGFHVADAATEEKFKKDFDETRKDLYRDVLFRIMREKLSAAGLEFECEPYEGPASEGPFRSRDGVAAVDRPMFEFWYEPHPAPKTVDFGFNRWAGPDGRRPNVIEAEAFTGQPKHTAWCETLASLKPMGDIYFQSGVNRLFLHSNPLQPYGEDVRPGMTMGRWGTHFGRTQTWAEPARAWFDYLRRCQALLQWGELSDARLPLKDPVRSLARTDGVRTLHFVVNMSDAAVPFALRGRWFDPVTGEIGGAPSGLAARQSGFLEPAAEMPSVSAERGPALCTVAGPWRIAFGGKEVVSDSLFEWTASSDREVCHYSGTAVYRTSFSLTKEICARATGLALGDTQGNVCEVSVNGRMLGTVWTAPWQVRVQEGVLRPGGNELEIRYTNTWANRLIGDEREAPEDCDWLPAQYGGWYPARWPEWLEKGLSARPSKGRKAWCAWKHFTKDSQLLPAGLLGPIGLR